MLGAQGWARLCVRALPELLVRAYVHVRASACLCTDPYAG